MFKLKMNYQYTKNINKEIENDYLIKEMHSQNFIFIKMKNEIFKLKI